MAKITMILAVEHGVLFVHGTGQNVNVPVNTGESNINVSDNCLAFRVKSYVDGDSIIEFGEIDDLSDCQEYFSGKISCVSKSLSISDSIGFVYASLPIDSEIADITLFMSTLNNPDWVKCVIHNVATF